METIIGSEQLSDLIQLALEDTFNTIFLLSQRIDRGYIILLKTNYSTVGVWLFLENY